MPPDPEFDADDYEITVGDDGIITERHTPGREPVDMVTVPHIVTGFSVGAIIEDGDTAFVIDFRTSGAVGFFRFAITPELMKTLVVGLVDALEREWT